MIPGPRIKTQAGPVALAVGDAARPAARPTWSWPIARSNNVEQFPGVGSGFFNDQSPTVYPVGQAPSALFLGNFGGARDRAWPPSIPARMMAR